jgi:hypothetical protein
VLARGLGHRPLRVHFAQRQVEYVLRVQRCTSPGASTIVRHPPVATWPPSAGWPHPKWEHDSSRWKRTTSYG